MVGRWWVNDPTERYWLEATDRTDIGVDLRAPLLDASGNDNWRYTLFRETHAGDVVFHYDSGRENAIIGWSRIAGPAAPAPIVWVARGSYARERGAVAQEVDGYRVPLEEFTRLEKPVTLNTLRAARETLRALTARLEADGKHPLYFPFELSEKRDVRPMQGYAFKLPAAFLSIFPELGGAQPDEIILSASADGATRNPPWTRDELILALDLYLTPFNPPLGKQSPEILALSELLGRMAAVVGRSADDHYRNANGVYMKLMNFRRFDPAFTTAGKVGLTRGNKLEAVVWEEFARDRPRLHATAWTIRAAVTGTEAPVIAALDDGGLEEAQEGQVLTRLHRVRERSRELVDRRKEQALRAAGVLRCEACGFDFKEHYGERGAGFIEAHHTKPVHAIVLGEKTKLADLALLCANCHRMVHARRPWLSVDELRDLIGGAPQG